MADISTLERAVTIAEGQSELARRMQAAGSRAKQQNIAHWLKVGRYPTDEVIYLARALNFEITPHEFDRVAYPNVWDGLPDELARPMLQQAGLAQAG